MQTFFKAVITSELAVTELWIQFPSYGGTFSYSYNQIQFYISVRTNIFEKKKGVGYKNLIAIS